MVFGSLSVLEGASEHHKFPTFDFICGREICLLYSFILTVNNTVVA